MYERLNKTTNNAVAYRITRPLSQEEMHQIANELEGSIEVSGKIRVLIDLQAFPYEHLAGLWEDLKFDVRHMNDIDRLALVGGGTIEKWSVRAFGTLTFTKCRCFEQGDVEGAWTWLTTD